MRNRLAKRARMNNPANLAAEIFGILSALATPFIIVEVLARWLPGWIVILWFAFGLNSLMTLIGCILLMSMARIEPYVYNVPTFYRAAKFAFVTALLMPLLLAAVAFLLLVGATDTPQEETMRDP